MLPNLETVKEQDSVGDGVDLVRDDACVNVESDPGIEVPTKSFEKATEISSRSGRRESNKSCPEQKKEVVALLKNMADGNVDQVPLPFVVGQDTTYATTGSEQVWVSQPSSGLGNHQATLQLCKSASGEQTVKPSFLKEKGTLRMMKEQNMTTE
eukprot:gene16243-7622_t